MTCPLCSSPDPCHDREECAKRLTYQDYLDEIFEQYQRDFSALPPSEQALQREGNNP